MIGRWLPAAALLLAAVAVVSVDPDLVSGLVALVLLVVAVGLSPLFFPRSVGDAAGQDAVAHGVPAIYWRPGCTYCLRLRFALARGAGRAAWVDVSTDADASARVRGVNGGDETVPTVFAGEEVRTNPAPTWVRERLPA